MKKILNYLYRHTFLIYKVLILTGALLMIIYLFSQTDSFQYEYVKNETWRYKNLEAPFDFTIKKSKEEIQKKNDSIKQHIPLFFKKKPVDIPVILSQIDTLIVKSAYSNPVKNKLIRLNRKLVSEIYNKFYLKNLPDNYKNVQLFLISSKHTPNKISANTVYTLDKIIRVLKRKLSHQPDYLQFMTRIYTEHLPENIEVDTHYYKRYLQQKLAEVSDNKGQILKGESIIKKGEIVTPEKYEILNSLKSAYGQYTKKSFHKVWIYSGYSVLVAMILLMLLLFLKQYRPEIYENNIKISLIIFNILLMLALMTFTVKYYPTYVFVVPLAILPLILKAFFDARTGLFVHVLTILLLGFAITNSFEFIFLQIIAGIVSILTVSELTKRSNLFTAVGNIVLVYSIGYLAFHLVYEGDFSMIDYNIFIQFIFNGLLTIALSHQLILLYEKLFGLVSDVSLLEYSNTNSKLLKRLADKAPGTFNHSMQVANLAEAAANAVHANSLLVRAGAIYHDIGKMLNPFYFTENQTSGVNYHDDLPPEESARIIIQHVLDGVEIARKNNLPDRIIDFIRTHHGTGLVQYFYKKAQEQNPDIDTNIFRYPGPNPFNKETAILMMADAVEAASKSLREPTAEKIDNFVDKIIDNQLHSGLLDNANITLKEISIIKKLFKKKLKNIYHLRIEYPE